MELEIVRDIVGKAAVIFGVLAILVGLVYFIYTVVNEISEE